MMDRITKKIRVIKLLDHNQFNVYLVD